MRAYKQKHVDESMDNAQKAEFQKRLRNGEVKFKYMKRDGSLREARGTMQPELMNLPKTLEDTTQKDVDTSEKSNISRRKLPSDSVFYYDLDSKGFRSFKMTNFIDYID